MFEIARDLCTYAGPCLFRWLTSCLPRVLCVYVLQGGIGSIGLLSFLFMGGGIVREKSFRPAHLCFEFSKFRVKGISSRGSNMQFARRP